MIFDSGRTVWFSLARVKRLSVELEHCYGIRSLQHTFDFSKGAAVAIYAPNGMMKSSLAQTFADVAENKDSVDRVFSQRVAKRKIVDERGSTLPADAVLVIRSYDETFAHTEKTSTLLVDRKLREEYEKLHTELDAAKEVFLKAMKTQSGSKKDLEREISSAFTADGESFYRALLRVRDEVAAQSTTLLANVPYDRIFDEKVLAFLQTKDFKTAIEDYLTRYNTLLSQSTYFRKGFEYFNATAIAKELADNGFFDAKHTVILHGGTKLEITSREQLEKLIEKEKEGIASDTSLQKKYAELEKMITKNISLREFKAYLVENVFLLPKLANIANLREEIWKAYFHAQLALFNDLVAKHQSVFKRSEEIKEIARGQRTQWESVIDIFNRRFSVPFKLEAKNRTSVILGQEAMLNLAFVFDDGEDTAPIERADLLRVLSTGEKKALYLLNVIFEIEARRTAQQTTVFVVDDVADSFDYKNKYAIIEYLKEISAESGFRQIILTHNFDFFRTLESRFVSYSSCLMASKTRDHVKLVPASGIKNVFVRDWKPNFFADERKRIACIPFMRNIVEYTSGESDPRYLKLTSLLHWRPDSETIDVAELQQLYCDLFGGTAPSTSGRETVVATILKAADGCLSAPEGANFEHKIVLSIAIRLEAEKWMVRKIADDEFWTKIDSNQTAKLFARTQKAAVDRESQDVLQRVMLMTPESIHLNSFMYEPILDMSDAHLRKLLHDVRALATA